MRSQVARDEQTLTIGSALALLGVVLMLAIAGVAVGSHLDVSVGLTGVLAGTVAMVVGAVVIVALAVPRHQ